MWDGYRIIEMPFSPVPPRDLTPAKARQFFTGMLEMQDGRIEELRGLVARNGYATGTDIEFQRSVVDFINAHAEAEPLPADTGYDLGPSAPHWALPIWQAVGIDTGFLLGAATLAEVPTLRWELLAKGGKLLKGYQWPVLKGFENGPWSNYYASPLTYAPGVVTGVVNGSPMKPLQAWIEAAQKYA
ncbi:UNVERIFIED_CONTAM: hypothetical protein OHV15_13010 [Microbacterium sp. SLM126]